MLKTRSWVTVLHVMIVCDIVAAFMALLWLKPVAANSIAQADAVVRLQLKPADQLSNTTPWPRTDPAAALPTSSLSRSSSRQL